MVKKTQESPAKPLVCPTCGLSQQSVHSSGRLGCQDCYVTFREVLADILPTMHAGPLHVGARPAPDRVLSAPVKVPFPDSLYRVYLVEALRTENYELAAGMRDVALVPAPALPSTSSSDAR